MDLRGLLPFLLLASLLLPGAGAQRQYQVGVSPVVVDLGEILPGTSRIGTFYLVTSSPDPLLVRLEAIRGTTNFFSRPEYQHLLPNYSEQDASPWVSFFENPVLLHPASEEVEQLAGKGFRPLNFLLRVPADAEPGVHTVMLLPTPSVPPGGSSAATIVAVVSPTLLFRVPGPSLRQGRILDITPGGGTRDALNLNIYFHNTGTVTLASQADAIGLYDAEGKLVATAQSERGYVQPDGLARFVAAIPRAQLPASAYVVRAHASYLTGETVTEAAVDFSKEPAGPPALPPRAAPWEIPAWAVLLPLILIGLFLYARRR
ncbi:MAG: hypothetical protein HY520_03100 [Candidatus Aenigmarchaeota archaeon]|nr:hypothetical protein [Candidatus Aenigmarchaeota archaeon]